MYLGQKKNAHIQRHCKKNHLHSIEIYLWIFSHSVFGFFILKSSSKLDKLLTGVGKIILLLSPRLFVACMADKLQCWSNKLFNVCLSLISSLLSRLPNFWVIMRRRLPRFESYPLRDLYTHVESVLKSSTECKIDELRVGRIADNGLVNLASPTMSASSSSASWLFAFPFPLILSFASVPFSNEVFRVNKVCSLKIFAIQFHTHQVYWYCKGRSIDFSILP